MNLRYTECLAALAALCLVAPLGFAQAPAAAPAPGPAPVAPAGAPPAPASTPGPVADEASSYSVGVAFGNQLHNSGLEHAVALDALIKGLKEGLAGKPVTNEDRERSIQLLRAGRDATAARNRVAAQEFLAKNATVAGIKTTASGLQYMVFEPGDAKAASPTDKDRVTVNYRGRLLDGTEFDNSDAHHQAATFGLEGVIKGWREALLMMKPGAKWRLFIPPALAYDTFSPPAIPPGSLLIFDIELLKVEARPVLGGPGGPALPAKPPRSAQPPASHPASPGTSPQ